MKKFLITSIATTLLMTTSVFAHSHGGHVSPEMSVKTDVKDVCNVEKLGIEKVLESAKKYNESAIKEDVEFRRLNVNNSDLIISIDEALKNGSKDVNPMHFQGKKRSKTKLAVDYATWRACSFALRALQQKHEAKNTWRLAVPGDGFKY